MEACTERYPLVRIFERDHRVACHAVGDEGRLRDASELPLLMRPVGPA
jgi:hypothetical protein